MSFDVINTAVLQPAAKATAGISRSLNNDHSVQQQKHNSFSSQRLVQAKMEIGAPNDAFEKEADAVADTVMRMPEQNFVQRKCAECEREEKLHRKPLSESITHFVQAKSEATPVVSNTTAQVIESSKGGGSKMANNTESFMSSRFGNDFSNVHIHTDNEAVQLNRELNAKAFTVGNDIYFNEGQYQPESATGKHLLAHELTHVVQQSNTVQTKKIQRLIRQSLVTCPGHNPFSADRRAVQLLDNAINIIDTARANRIASPASAEVTTVSNAMRTAFRLNPGNVSNWDDPAPHFGLLLIRRRLEAARDYINSVVFTINCIPNAANHIIPGCLAGTCNAGTEAFSCHVNATEMVLCPDFWALPNDNQRARTFMHEVFHITFQTIDDWANPNRRNAHCYAQFTALLNGFNSPAGFRCH